MKQNNGENQGDSTFLTDVHQAILNETHKKSRTNRKRTLTMRIIYNYSTALERPVINYLGGGGGGLNRFYARTTLALGSAVVRENIIEHT